MFSCRLPMVFAEAREYAHFGGLWLPKVGPTLQWRMVNKNVSEIHEFGKLLLKNEIKPILGIILKNLINLVNKKWQCIDYFKHNECIELLKDNFKNELKIFNIISCGHSTAPMASHKFLGVKH